ncbi:hypothetical protein CSW41_04595 [Thermus scotoductus]|uniref:Uncharacterized protein n=1 Tax=Thermus scotoductus TaxID=37636 RepID=A0A430RMP6_THESC|nr:hypothetical protein [Thermus scotoductus]RTH19177.1 hypothetical protein CSW41_04595 [Thermus scotoductus]
MTREEQVRFAEDPLEQVRFAEDPLERGASLEEWLKALEDYPYSPYTWSRVAEDPRIPPEVLVKLLAHPWYLVAEEAAKTLAGHPEATNEHLAALVDEVLFRNKLFTTSLKDAVAATLIRRGGDEKPEWLKLVLIYELSRL